MSAAVRKPLPLLDGQQLQRDEFLRRYEALPHIKKAELIGGIVRMGSPVSLEHGTGDNEIVSWIGFYSAFTPGCEAANNSTWLMLTDAPQPDGALRILPEFGGTSRVKGKYASGAAELIAEVSNTSADIDLGEKKKLYAAAGVREYLVLALSPRRRLYWFRRSGRGFKEVLPPADGVIRSTVFPGLWLDVPALLRRDMAKVMTVLQRGLQSGEHEAFVQELPRRRSK